MANDYVNTFAGCPVGTEATAANSGGTANTPLSFVIKGTGATYKYLTDGAKTVLDMTYGTGTNYVRHDDSSVTNEARRVFSCRFKLKTGQTGSIGLMVIRSNGTVEHMGQLNVTAARKMSVGQRGNAAVTNGTGTTTLDFDTWYRAELAITAATLGSGRMEYKLYSDANTLLESYDSGNTLQTSTFMPNSVRWADASSTATPGIVLSDLRSASRDSGFLGPVQNTPTVNAGLDQELVDALSTVTLSATASTAVSTWAWTQTAGPAVTFTGQGTNTITFKAPAATAGATVTFSANGDGGTDSVTVTVKPHLTYFRLGGKWVPHTPKQKINGIWR